MLLRLSDIMRLSRSQMRDILGGDAGTRREMAQTIYLKAEKTLVFRDRVEELVVAHRTAEKERVRRHREGR